MGLLTPLEAIGSMLVLGVLFLVGLVGWAVWLTGKVRGRHAAKPGAPSTSESVGREFR